MTSLTAKEFQDAEGTAEWSVLAQGASAWFAASSYSAGGSGGGRPRRVNAGYAKRSSGGAPSRVMLSPARR